MSEPLTLKVDGTWTVLPYGQPVTNGDGIQASYETVILWSVEEQEAFGVFQPEPAPEPPAGKVEAQRDLIGEDRPRWAVTYQDAPSPAPAYVPENVTNSDWRVGLILWGRFDEVEAKVVAARDAGTVEGKVVWQRWEYANEVFRSELMALRETFGFTVEEVDESMRRGAAVTEQTRQQAQAALAARAAA